MSLSTIQCDSSADKGTYIPANDTFDTRDVIKDMQC